MPKLRERCCSSRHNDKDKLPGPPATPSCRTKPGWRPRSASAVGSLAAPFLLPKLPPRSLDVAFRVTQPSCFEAQIPVMGRSPDRPTCMTEGLAGIPGDVRSVVWHGQETVPQRGGGDRATTGWRRPCHNGGPGEWHGQETVPQRVIHRSSTPLIIQRPNLTDVYSSNLPRDPPPGRASAF